MLVKKSEITFSNTLTTLTSRPTYKNEMKQVVVLFKERKIPTLATARKIIDGLGSKNKKTNITALERLEGYRNSETLSGRLTRLTGDRITKHFVRGVIHTTSKYTQTRKRQITAYGRRYHNNFPYNYELEAKTKRKRKQRKHINNWQLMTL